MFNKQLNINQKNLLLSLYVIILGIFVPAIYWMSNTEPRINDGTRTVDNPIQKRISLGEEILITANNSLEKQSGVQAFADGDYVNALSRFASALQENPNDPEARIYLNNTYAAKTEDPHKIGVSVPIGGDLGVAQEILRGVAQAQNKINQNGGINGKLVMVEIANDDNDPEVAKEIAESFAEDEKVLAVVGHNDSNASVAAAPIYQDNGLVMVTPTSSAEIIPKMGDYIFRTTPSARNLADTLAEYAVKTLGRENIAMCIDSGSEVSVSLKENFTYAVYNYGGQINPLSCDFSAADFSPESIPSRAISNGADALLLAPSVRKVNKAMEIVRANQDRLALLGNHSLNTYKTLKEGQNNANGMVLTVPWSPQDNEFFAKDARELWGGGVNWRTAMAYDAAQTIFKAISLGAERQEVKQALGSPNFSAEGASSKISFLPTGDRNMQGTLVEVEPGNRSGTGFDFKPIELEKAK